MNDADTTWALVIGIDVYDNVTPLAGAVLDAIEVVGWLRDLGVKDDRILLHASPCTAAVAPLKALGIPPRDCTEPEIWSSLSTLLDNNGSRLFVFLLGHGFYLLDGGCVFLTKEADHNALTNYGIDWLADLLRGRKYDRQFIVMDGCLNYAYPPSDRPTVEPGRHPGAKVDAPLEGVSQWFARAASQGETAAEPNSRGLFTSKLLETLNLTSPNPRCTVINDTTGEYEIDLYTAITNIVSPTVSKSIPTQHPGIKRLDEGPADGQAIVAAVAPKGTVALQTLVDPAAAVADIDSVTLQSRQYLWRRTIPAVTDTSLKLPFTTVLPIDMNLIGWCDLKPSTDWRDPDPLKRTTGDGRDIVFTLEKDWSSQTLKVTTIGRDNAVVAAMTPDALNAASDVIAAEDGQDTIWLSPSRTGAVLRTQVGYEQLLPAISQRIADAIDINTPGEVHTSIEFRHLPPPEPRWQGWTLDIDLDLTHADALGGFAADRDDVRIDGVSMSLHQLANRRQVAISGLGPALVELNLPWGRWTTIVEPPDDPTKAQPRLEFPETVGLPPIRNTLRDTVLKPGSDTVEDIAAGRPAFALAVTSDEQIEVFAASSGVAKQVLDGASPTDGWTALEDHGERLGEVTIYAEPPRYWPIGRLVSRSNSSSLYFPMYIPNLAFDNRIAPRLEPLSIDPSPLWDLLVSAGRLHSLTEDSAWKVLKKNANNPVLTFAASYASYIDGFTEPLEKLLEPWIRVAKDGETASGIPDVVILWHAYAMNASASQTRAHPVLSRPNPQRLQELATRGRVPMLRWGVSIGRSVAEHYDIPELAANLAHIEDRLKQRQRGRYGTTKAATAPPPDPPPQNPTRSRRPSPAPRKAGRPTCRTGRKTPPPASPPRSISTADTPSTTSSSGPRTDSLTPR